MASRYKDGGARSKEQGASRRCPEGKAVKGIVISLAKYEMASFSKIGRNYVC